MAGKALKEKLEERLNISDTAETEVISHENNNVVPFSKSEQHLMSIVPDFAITLNEAKDRISMLQSFVSEMMLPGIDFGIVPGCSKPSLLKPGAEKLCDIFGFSKQIDIINRMEDWEKGIFHYEIKATLISKRTGHIEAEGIGSCNNKEKKYKNQEPANTINTVLKMAKKRALVDAVLSATRSSGIFTQDMEDQDPDSPETIIQNKRGSIISGHNPVQHTKSAEAIPADKSQLVQVMQLICQKKIPLNKARNIMFARYKVNESKYLTSFQAEDFIAYLKKYRAG